MRTNRREIDTRQQAILHLVRERGEVRCEDIAAAQSVSVMTVRRDLQLLEERGLLRRTHGGAISLERVHAG